MNVVVKRLPLSYNVPRTCSFPFFFFFFAIRTHIYIVRVHALTTRCLITCVRVRLQNNLLSRNVKDGSVITRRYRRREKPTPGDRETSRGVCKRSLRVCCTYAYTHELSLFVIIIIAVIVGSSTRRRCSPRTAVTGITVGKPN